MIYRYSFHGLKNDDLICWLEGNDIPYTFRETFVCFEIKSTNSKADVLLKQLCTMRIIGPCVTAEFTPTELANAKYLMISPTKQCVDIINAQETYSKSCTWSTSMGYKKVGHMEQIGHFKIAKEPSSKTSTAFWHEDTGFAEIFTDRRVYSLAKQNDLEGIVFNPVYLKKGSCSENIFQMTSDCKIAKDCIEFGHGERRLTCHLCGKEQFFINSAYQLHLYMDKLEPNKDLYVTERIFGEGIPYPVYIISQRFYQLLKANKLTGRLDLLPVVEVVK